MPELPEVETLRRDLERVVAGRRLVAAQVTGMRSIRRHPTPSDFAARLESRVVSSVRRRGKYLLAGLDSGDVLVIHLGMSGQLLSKRPTEPTEKHTHVVLDFSPTLQIRFVDPRTFGELFVTASGGGRCQRADISELAYLGADPLDNMLTLSRFSQLLAARRSQLKSLLMNQRFLAGIGNIYSDEILFAAKLRYDRTSDTLTATEARCLYRAMVDTLSEAIAHRGSSLSDLQYRDLFGAVGGFQARHQVYGREGQACRRCRSSIVRLKAAGRSHFMCGQCQA